MKTHTPKGRINSNKLPGSPPPCMKESTLFLLIFSIYLRQQTIALKVQYCVTPATASAPPLANTGKFILKSTVDRKSLWVESSCQCQCHRENTRTHKQKDTRRRALERGAPFKWNTEQRVMGTAGLCKVGSDAPSPSSNVHVC